MAKTLSEVLIKEFKANKINYDWEFPQNGKIDFPENLQSDKDKNLYLKEHLMSDLRDEEKYLERAYWIINDWGKIRSFRKCDENNKRLRNFKDKLDSGKKLTDLTDDEINVIPSLSKVASFYSPKEFVIYDSRVAFSLNGLIILYDVDSELFYQPMPKAGTKLAKMLKELKPKLDSWKTKKHTKGYRLASYLRYCDLLNKAAADLGNGTKNYELEMFLFMLKDDESFVSKVVKKLNSI